MTSLLPLASYNLALSPFTPTQAIESDLPVTVHLTLAAIDPANAIDEEAQPSTLRILKSSVFNNLDDEDDEDDDDLIDDEAEEDEDDEDEEDEEEEEPKPKSKKSKRKQEEEDEDDDDEEDEDEDLDSDEDLDLEDDEDDAVEEFVVCTLSPSSQYQQTLDLTISPDEEVFFVVTGSYPIHLSGNYVEHPYDDDEDEYDSEDEEDEDYDLSPDEDELLEEGFDINDLEDDESDIEGKIEELVEEEEAAIAKEESKKAKKDNKKRQSEETQEEEVKLTKKQKKAAAAAKAAEEKEKAVEFKKGLEQGPTKNEKKVSTKTLAGGVVIEDRTVGKGPTAKNGSKVGVRYIGKLKNGSVFDKNTSGKPFTFNLGKGEVIKGWDVGVAGMAVGGERRINIPAPYAYGKRGAPGAIPPNSDLTFDVKLVSLK